MIADIIQDEKNRITEILSNISNTVDKLQFLSMSDYEVSKEFKKRWEFKLKKFFSYIENYQRSEFPLVILGRWNSGKSTLINAILGKDILPAANKEMTSVLTKIYYGNSRDVILRFDKDINKTIQVAEIEDYVNFRGEKYTEKLKQIDIESDNSFLKSGLCILDTPGLNSINDLNNNITFNVIPRANSVILTFSGLDVGGNDNLTLIEQVLRLNYNNLYNVVFVITKSDLLSEKEIIEAKESLNELISVAQNNTGVDANFIHICILSSYMELKYKQYLANDISKEQLLNDSKLGLSDINKLQVIHNKSNFEEFYKILDKSILNSANKKNVTNNLFFMIQNMMAELLEDYNNTYECLSQSNNNTLEQISTSLQRRVNIQTKIVDEGEKEIKNFNEKIEVLTFGKRRVTNVINDIFVELCNYIDNTEYGVISKDKFEQLNLKINMVSSRLITDWMKDIKKEFDEELKKTIMEIAEIIEKNSKELDDVFLQKNQETNLNIYGIYMKTNLALSSVMLSCASSVSVGAGLFTIGNGILPGIGGIIGGIAGGLIGFIASMLDLNNSDTRKENLKRGLNKYLFEREYEYHAALKELYLQYKDIVKLLEQYLHESLEQVTREKETIISNYNDTKVKFSEIERKLTTDIQAIRELMPEISLFFTRYIKNS